MPSACRRLTASRVTVRETPYSVASWASVMKKLPSASCSRWMRWRIEPGQLVGLASQIATERQ